MNALESMLQNLIILESLNFYNFLNRFKGGILIKTIQFGVYKFPGVIPIAVQEECVKILTVRFHNPVYSRKFVLGIAT